MSIYVAIVLLSALSVFNDDHPPDRGEVFLFELGTTVGLVLAHGFASWISTRVIGEGDEDVDPWDLLRVQIGGALFVAVLAMLALVLTPTSIELAASRLTVAATIAALVFLESRTSNSECAPRCTGCRARRGRNRRRDQGAARALTRAPSVTGGP